MGHPPRLSHCFLLAAVNSALVPHNVAGGAPFVYRTCADRADRISLVFFEEALRRMVAGGCGKCPHPIAADNLQLSDRVIQRETRD